MTRKPFTTDGCSGGMSWFWRLVFRHPPPWEGACIEHDKRYWEGGTANDRQQADLDLEEAVIAKGYPHLAAVMYYAIRIGGHPWWPFSWRWDYGNLWPGKYNV